MWPNPQVTADLVTFTKEIPRGKPHFLCSDNSSADWLFSFKINEDYIFLQVSKYFYQKCWPMYQFLGSKRFGVNLLEKNFSTVFFSSFFTDFILLIFVSFKILWVINPFLTNILISYPRKAAEYLRFYGIFRGYKMGALPRNGLRHSVCSTLCTSKRCLKMTAKLGRWGLSG